MKPLRDMIARAVAAAATLTGKRFGLLVASSLVATSAIVAAAMTSSNGNGLLEGLLGRSLAADRTPAASAPARSPEATAGPAEASTRPAPSAGPSSSSPSEEFLPAPAPEALPAGEPEEAPPPLAPEEPKPEAGRIKHVFVVSLASSGYEASFGASSQMPYLASTLRPQGDLLSNYSLLDDATLPNSIATVSGQAPTAATKADCPNYGDCVYPATTLTLADQLDVAQFSWRAYMENMVSPETGQPANCVYPQPGAPEEAATGGYAVRLNPFAFFHSLLDLGSCSSEDVPLTELEKNLKKAKSTPNFSYIAPDLCDSGFSGQCAAGSPEGAASADAFLSTWVPKILASPAYKADGLLIVAFSASNPPVAGTPAPANPLKTGALLLSPFVTPDSTDGVAYGPYSLLRSSEELFGLGLLEGAKAKKVKSFAPALLTAGEDGGD